VPYAKSRERKYRNQHEKRDCLSKIVGKTDCFTATFVKYSWSNGSHERKILITGVKDSQNRYVAQHIWLPLTEEIRSQHLDFGDRFEFVGTIVKYEKGTITDNLIYEDFTIADPVQVQKIGIASF
jgi:hypothetical protein